MGRRRVDLAVLGGGTAGLVAAIGAAAQGARVVLVERARTGGDCLWTGCVPSKALLEVARRAHVARTSETLGVTTGDVHVDLGAALAHVRGAIAAIEPHDAPDRLRAEGVEVITGHGRFVGPETLEVAGRPLVFRRALVATGASPAVPATPGLREVAPLTSETVWELTDLPRRLLVLGAGAVGVELGQAFARLGADVTLVEAASRVLPRAGARAGEVLARSLAAEGIELRLGRRVVRVDGDHSGGVASLVEVDGPATAAPERVAFDRVLVAVGRVPRTDGLGLDRAQVRRRPDGAVAVDRHLRTSNPRIYAAGDVTGLLPFTHVAAAHGAAVVQHALFGLPAAVRHDRIPWAVFTDPEVGRVGLDEVAARARFGDRARVRTVDHRDLDRAIATAATGGFTQLVGDPRGRLVGATVVGPRAGETIAELAVWLGRGARLRDLVRTTHPYPTWSEGATEASLGELREGLARLRPITRAVLALQRLAR